MTLGLERVTIFSYSFHGENRSQQIGLLLSSHNDITIAIALGMCQILVNVSDICKVVL